MLTPEPDSASFPLHEPSAVQPVAFVVVQVRAAELPAVTVVGFAAIWISIAAPPVAPST